MAMFSLHHLGYTRKCFVQPKCARRNSIQRIVKGMVIQLNPIEIVTPNTNTRREIADFRIAINRRKNRNSNR
jgi:hypothetical protein